MGTFGSPLDILENSLLLTLPHNLKLSLRKGQISREKTRKLQNRTIRHQNISEERPVLVEKIQFPNEEGSKSSPAKTLLLRAAKLAQDAGKKQYVPLKKTLKKGAFYIKSIRGKFYQKKLFKVLLEDSLK